MRFVSFDQASSYFEVAGKARINWRSLEDPAVERFSEAVFKLSKLSRQQDDDTGWRRFLYPARRARNIVTTVPLPHNSGAVCLSDLMGQLHALLPMLRIYAGEEAVRLGEEAVEVGTELAGLDYSPLLNMVLDLAGDTAFQSNGLLLPLTDFLGSVRDHLKLRLGAQQTTIHALR